MGLKTKSIGITGGSGFIGTNLKLMMEMRRINFIEFKGNLLNDKDVSDFFTSNQISTVIHLAGSFSGSYEDLINANLMTTQKLLETGLRFGLKKIIYSSTGGVYGNTKSKTGSKETDNTDPNTLYALTKSQSEESIKYYSMNNKLIGIILRFPNVYGPGSRQGVIHNFISDIKEKKEITIFGSGKQTRQFLHVDDACKAILLALQWKTSDIFNITNPKEYTLNEITGFLKKYYAFSVIHLPQNNKLTHMKLDPGKSAKILKFSPQYTKISF